MDNVTKEVYRIIDRTPSMREGMNKGIINKRALASFIVQNFMPDKEVNAVISAIRRYPVKERTEVFVNAFDIVSESTLSSKNGIVSITLNKEEAAERVLPELFSVIEVEKHQSLRVIQADESIKVIIDKKNLNKVKELIPEQSIKKIDEDLAEVIIHLDKRTWSTPGIASILTTELSLNNINIVEMMSCIPEIIIFFKEKDLMEAYNVLYGTHRQK
ncbi:MAG: hypothetical protein ACQEP1_05690 [Nanobdellota archaeon]